MQINSVSGLTPATSGLSASSTGTTKGTASFSNVFNDAMNQISEINQSDSQNSIALVSGEDTGLEKTMVDSEKAKLTLELGIAIRNKVLDAYNEIIKMQI